MFIRDPGSWFLPIPDPKTAMKDKGEKKLVVIPFFWSHKFHKIEPFYFWNVEENNLGQFSKNSRTFYLKKIVSKLSKIWVWDPRSGIRKKPFPDPGSRGQKGTGSGSATLESGFTDLRILEPIVRLHWLCPEAWSTEFSKIKILDSRILLHDWTLRRTARKLRPHEGRRGYHQVGTWLGLATNVSDPDSRW